MKNSHHVHEVLEMLAFAAQDFSRNDLETEIAAVFGTDAIFSNCADKIFNVKQVVDFMLEKGKIEEKEGAIRLVSQACDH